MRTAASNALTLFAVVATISTLACRTSAVDEPPKAAMVEQAPPAPTAPVTGEFALGEAPPQAPVQAPDPPPKKERHPGNDRPARAEALTIGAPCPATEAAPSAPVPGRPPAISACGTKARVSVVWDDRTASLGHSAPCKLEALGRRVGGTTNAKDAQGMTPTSACVRDGRLYVQSVCMYCRMADAGWSGIALIGEMTRGQALALQLNLGLPAKDPLLTDEAWTKALAAARS